MSGAQLDFLAPVDTTGITSSTSRRKPPPLRSYESAPPGHELHEPAAFPWEVPEGTAESVSAALFALVEAIVSSVVLGEPTYSEPFRVLSADPPWRFKDTLPGNGRGAEKHYPTLSVADLMRFPLPPIADDAVLFLWRVASLQQEALDVGRAWGFELKSEIVWNKSTKTGKRHFGMGRTVRAEHETCLILTRGKPERLNASTRSTFRAPVGRHSAKPAKFYKIVESLYPGPYVELFARAPRRGWTVLGNQAGGP